MKDCFEKIEQEDEARGRFKQRVVRRLLEANAVAMAKDKLAHKDVEC